MRFVAWGVAGVTALALGLAAWLLLDRFDLGPLAAWRLSASLGRPVSFGALHVTPGRWLLVQVQDARIRNLPGGTRETMAELASGTAEIEAWPLLRGALVLRRAKLEGLDVLLERVEAAGPNWRFKDTPPERGGPPVRDGAFPNVAEVTVSGKVVVRTSAGVELPVGLNGVTFSAPGLDAPTRLAGAVSYNGAPFQVEAGLGSIAQYRRAAEPFPATFDLVSGGTRLRFEGTMTDPLNLDGALGRLLLEAATPDVLYRVAGLDASFKPSLRLDGAIDHAGPAWQLSGIKGALGPAPITDGTLRLDEGLRPAAGGAVPPDRVAVALDFEHLEVDKLLGGGKAAGQDDMSLEVDRQPTVLLAVKLHAKQLSYGAARFTAVALEASRAPDQVAIHALSLTYAGGKVLAAATLDAADHGGRLAAEVKITGMEVQALRSVLDLGRLPLNGRLNGQAAMQAAGATLNAAMRAARGSVVATMAGGSVSREVVELGSTDARALFRTARGTVPLSCALAIVDVRAGMGSIAPIRLRTAEGTIAGRGTMDLVRGRLDLTVASESRTTSLFALDVPVRVSGPFSDLSVAPAQLSAAGRAQAEARDAAGRLLPSVQAAARASPCLER